MYNAIKQLKRVSLHNKIIKKIGVILRPSTPELKNTFHKLKEVFNKYDIDVYLDSASGDMIELVGMDFDLLCKRVDALVTLGGDGTLIATVRKSFDYDLPTFGVYAGNLGFLADVSMDELDEFVKNITLKKYRIDERAVLEIMIKIGSKQTKLYAFNDIVLTRHSVSNMIHIETLIDGKSFNTYYGDGVIVSTPTGSTAYNISAGGPVVFPLSNVFTLTPICPHSLTQRPMVLPGTFSMEMKTPRANALVIVDGQDIHELAQGESVHIKLAEKRANLIHREEFNYFDVLKEKLSWGE
ncbi:NAD(+)/NADH kinase [Sulfurimonas sp.]|uniref:NAD(+)/NADH kinase n=1 Tax=Sulfurimonas sp. TaxID=2022749 RepID=UPI002B499A28|nr:NAD(+)/NADH kinase [Sulfurimonas sp.]